MKKFNFFGATFLAAAMAITVACDEDDLKDLLSEGDAQVSESYVKTEAALVNLYSIIDASLRDSTFQATDSAVVDGATVIRSGSNISINFGTGVLGQDGNT